MLGTLIVAGGLILGQAAPGPDAELAARVEELVDRLDARSLADREEAEQALVELGPAILDLLPGEDDRVTAEAKIRLGRIRQKLQRERARQATEPSRVTLQGTMPATNALAAIQEQTGNRIVGPPPAAGQGPEVTVDLDGVPFWQALDAVLDQAGLDVYPYGTREGLPLRPRDPDRQPRAQGAAYAGPFRIEPASIEARRDLRNPAGRLLRLNLEIAWEPGTSPVSIQYALADVEAMDGQGNPLPLADTQAEPTIAVSGDRMAAEFLLPFALPPRDVEKIATLKGKIQATVPGETATFRFENLSGAKNVEKRVAGAKVVLERVGKNRDVWEVRVAVRYDRAAGSLASHYNWIYENDAFLEDPGGKRIDYASIQGTRRSEDEVGMAYLFVVDGPLDGYEFVYKTPGMILTSEFEYELGDIPLP